MRTFNGETGAFSGVGQIFLYNWHFYAGVLILDLLAVGFETRFSPHAGIRAAINFVVAVSTFWALSSLLVSHYVYDRSSLYQWTWLASVVRQKPRSWANIHAGLDQSSEALRRIFPDAVNRVIDIYLSAEMSEPSIRRARKHAQSPLASEKADPSALPLADGECDTIFLIFVAHELRSRAAKLRFFGEVHRALEPGGSAVLVEHLRDWRNLLAYGPGAFHFFPRREWLAVCRKSGLEVAREMEITPFVRCFVLARNGI
jgi:SAM-dependent methyltransferase